MNTGQTNSQSSRAPASLGGVYSKPPKAVTAGATDQVAQQQKFMFP